MQRTTESPSSSNSAADPRAAKARLFGDESGDRLHKQVIKARFLRNLQQPTGGLETHESSEHATVPNIKELPDAPVRVARYAVLRKLGQGGMGVVYVAYDEDLDRKIAIKLLRGDLLKDDRGRARMLREAQALARLSHPNVVQVHEVGQWNDHDYVAMEYVEGQTLDRWVGEQDRSWPEVLEVLTQAGRGLEAAHQAGLVHRDFKPANLMISSDGRARVLDFGLARAADERDTNPNGTPILDIVATAEHSLALDETRSHDSEETRASGSVFDKMLTVTGALLGTPAYMSPEQHLGQRATVLSDQFSFCVVLYEALFGRRPFKGESRIEYAVHVAEGRVEAPPSNSGVPAWLRKVIMRGLSPKPEDRWPSMTALLAELRRDRTHSFRGVAVAVGLLAAFGVALAVNGSDEPQSICEFDPATAIASWGADDREAVAAAFANTGMAEADAVLEHTRRSLDTYAGALTDARAEACTARWVDRRQTDADLELRTTCLDQRERELAAVVGVLVDADREVVLHAPELVAGLGDVGLCERVDLLEAGTPAPKDAATVVRIAEVRTMIAEAHAARDVGRIADAKGLTEAAWRAAESLGFEPLIGELHVLAARNSRFERDFVGARTALIEAVTIAQRHQLLELSAEAWVELATIVARQGQEPDALLEFKLAAAAIQQLGTPARHAARLEYAKGLARLKMGQSGAAIAAFDKALDQCSSGFFGSDYVASMALAARADALATLGRLDEARAALERVVSTRGAWSRPQLDALFDLAIIEIQSGEIADGERDLLVALEGYESLFGPNYEAIGHGELARGKLAFLRGDIGVAEEAFARALQILDASHPEHDYVLDALATIQVERSEFSDAELTLRKALSHRERVGAGEQVRLAYLRGRLASVYRRTGEFDSAISEFDVAIRGLEEFGVEAPLDLAAVLIGRGETRLEQGQVLLALDSVERAIELLPVDSGEARLAGESRALLAEILKQLDIRHDEQRELAKAAVRILTDLPGSEDALARARGLSNPSAARKSTIR